VIQSKNTHDQSTPLDRRIAVPIYIVYC